MEEYRVESATSELRVNPIRYMNVYFSSALTESKVKGISTELSPCECMAIFCFCFYLSQESVLPRNISHAAVRGM